MSLFGGLNNNNASSAPNAGGLFGSAAPANNNNSAPPGGDLFSRISKDEPKPATGDSSLFGGAMNQPASSAQASSSLFGGTLGAGTSQAPGTSLFGNTTTSKPAAPSLFGGAGATSQPAASSGGGSLFGGAAPAATSGGSSLFGGSTAAKPASGGLFGTSTNQPASGAGTGGGLFGSASGINNQQSNSLFGGLTGGNQQNENQQQVARPEQAPANPSYFDQLLERGKKRQNEERLTPFGELPALELGLADISRKVRNMGQGGPSAGLARGGDARAHYLLSASGVNTNQALRDLEQLADQHATQPAVAAQMDDALTGVKFDLARKHHDDFQAMVDGRIKQAQENFNKMIDEQLHGVNWGDQYQRIYEHFGLKKPQHVETGARDSFGASESGAFGRSGRRTKIGASVNGKSFGVPGLSKSVIGTVGRKTMRDSQFGDINDKLPREGMRIAPEDRMLRIKQDKYIERVKELNVARIQERAYPMLNKFADVESEPSGEDNSMLIHAYKALAQITGEDPTKENQSDPGAIKPRQYARDYLDDTANAKGPIAVRKRIINGSRTFLEQLFYSQVKATIDKNNRDANVGGVPTALAKVKGYARVRAVRRELGPDLEILQQVGNDYCWVVMFYLLRCGLLQEALEYVQDNQSAFRNIDRRFQGYLQNYVQDPDRRLKAQAQTDINNDYSQRAKIAPEDSIDPYRMMCYKIIGRCDLSRRNFEGNVTSDMMDWMWLQFALAREYNRVDEFAHEAYGLDELRSSIKDIGERYFGPGSELPNAPTTFFFMQTLAGLFEKAIADLYPHNYISATHFAIALDYYGLLRVSDITNSDDLLTHTTRQQPQIAFGAMVGLYTRDFRTADPTAAVDYLSLICLNADLTGDLGKAQRELCHQALTELVLETREFASLLGDIRADGQRIQGSIEQRLKLIGLEDEQEFLRHITIVAARTAEDQSRTSDAALLFHLAEDYDKVTAIVNDAVSLALTTELGEEPQKLTPLKPRQGEGEQVPRELQGSLSLTAVDNPVDLARSFKALYAMNRMYYEKIKSTTSDSRDVLLFLAEARRLLEAGQWAAAVDVSFSHTTHIRSMTH